MRAGREAKNKQPGSRITKRRDRLTPIRVVKISATLRLGDSRAVGPEPRATLAGDKAFRMVAQQRQRCRRNFGRPFATGDWLGGGWHASF